MKIEELSKYEALRLVTPVIDEEVCAKTRAAFFEHMENCPEVNYLYKSRKGIKKLLKKRCPRAKASADLHQRIKSIITLQRR